VSFGPHTGSFFSLVVSQFIVCLIMRKGIFGGANDMLFEYNHVHDMCYEVSYWKYGGFLFSQHIFEGERFGFLLHVRKEVF
jgi:hypothetical protein